MGYKTSQIVDTGGFPFYLINSLIKHTNVPYFIETGTASGGSIREAAKCFKTCHTIELIEGRADIDATLTNVTWHTGNSIDILPGIVGSLVKEREIMNKGLLNPVYNYALFFLDAHYSDPQPNTSKHKECYLLEEIEIISSYRDDSIIIIDDARLFFGHPPAPNNPKEWPNIQEIFCLLKEKLCYNYSSIVDDYIISIPERLREPMDAEWVANYEIRYPTEENKLKQEVKNVYSAFKKYIDVT